MLPDPPGLEVIGLGYGTAYFGAWLRRHGASSVVGVDITPNQLATARRVNDETGLGLEFIEANAEAVPLPGGSFDLALSEYGALIWCDPHLWIPEAARLLRPGGELVFLQNTPLSMLCTPDTGTVVDALQRPQRGHAPDGIDRRRPRGGVPPRPRRLGPGPAPERVRDPRPGGALRALRWRPGYYDYVPAEWASRWPAEEIWRVTKT
ncbi:MAG TPA: class I SAM-dependent methyltransferase [Candidatus Dormibacteraeota bacterium]|nr:class I SAM-dependent methyltransferase [Candidatus Dormibacteraeota bacterium]